MSTVFDNDILIHHIAAPGLPGDGFTVPEAAILRADLDTLLARPVVTQLDDIPDVNVSGVTDAQVLRYDAATDTWIAGAAGRVIANVQEAWGAGTLVEDVAALRPMEGISVVEGTPGTAYLKLEFGGTGTSTSVARSNHTHTHLQIGRVPISPQAYMSGGTRTLATTSIVIGSGLAAVIEAKLRFQVRGGDPGASYYTLNLNIGGNTKSSGSGTNGFWCVQGVPKETELVHSIVVPGTGVATVISATVSWNSGGGFYTDAGELEIKATYNR